MSINKNKTKQWKLEIARESPSKKKYYPSISCKAKVSFTCQGKKKDKTTLTEIHTMYDPHIQPEKNIEEWTL